MKMKKQTNNKLITKAPVSTQEKKITHVVPFFSKCVEQRSDSEPFLKKSLEQLMLPSMRS